MAKHRAIEWNKVTWYSKVLSAVILLGILPFIILQFGIKYGEARGSQSSAITIAAPPIPPSRITCNFSDSSAEQNACVQNYLVKANAELAKLYSLVEHGATINSTLRSPTMRAAFQRSQAAWSDFKDKECVAEASVYTDANSKVWTSLNCQYNLTYQRIQMLSDWLGDNYR